jgi:hypothetical protein
MTRKASGQQRTGLQSAASTMGKKGGPARAKVLPPGRRSEIASQGAKARNAKK